MRFATDTTLELVNRGGNFFFFFLNWTKIRLRMILKVRNVRLGVFSGGGCHHPYSIEMRSSKNDIHVTRDIMRLACRYMRSHGGSLCLQVSK